MSAFKGGPSAAAVRWQKKNREKYLAYRREFWRRRSPEKVAAEAEAKRGRRFQRKYGITLDHYNELLLKQAGVCALCKHPTRRGSYGGFLDVDHDHVTGTVRGLLCISCNHALGVLGDNVEGLERALAYLKG